MTGGPERGEGLTLRERRKGRETALQALYQLDITNDEAVGSSLAAFSESFETSENAREFAAGLVHGVRRRREELDGLIAGAIEHWRFERLSRVDLNVLRLSVYELTTPPVLPPEIAINEAVEIARRFGTAESAAFVNGVLDQIAARLGLKARGEAKSAESE
jgi:transcription antitermination protein NusB